MRSSASGVHRRLRFCFAAAASAGSAPRAGRSASSSAILTAPVHPLTGETETDRKHKNQRLINALCFVDWETAMSRGAMFPFCLLLCLSIT